MVLYSSSPNQYYMGYTENVEDRIFRHTNPGSKTTIKVNDWIVKYTEQLSSRTEAFHRELEIKK